MTSTLTPASVGEDQGVQRAIAPRLHAEQRPFVHLLDPSTPSARDLTIEYGAGLASGVKADRPLPSSFSSDRAAQSLALGYGITARISPFVVVRQLLPSATDDSTKFTANAGLRWQITAPDSAFRLGVSAAFVREFEGDKGGYLRVAASYDIDRVRIAANAHAEKIFAPGRDSIDLLSMTGVSYRALDQMRVGVEYVAQDLEDAFEHEEAEGGVRHFVGPTAALDLDRGRFQIVGGPAFGLNDRAPKAMGRVALLLAF